MVSNEYIDNFGFIFEDHTFFYYEKAAIKSRDNIS